MLGENIHFGILSGGLAARSPSLNYPHEIYNKAMSDHVFSPTLWVLAGNGVGGRLS